MQKKDSVFPNTLIVNIGAMSTSLAIVKGGIIVFTYSIAIGGAAINRAIASDFGFSLPQAEEYKKTYGISQQELGGKISDSTKPILLSIIGEVKKALAFYKDKYKNDTPLQQVLLTGGTAKLPGIDLFFAQNCEIETATANPWHVLGEQQIPREILDNASDYTIAIGLALRDYE
jgi:type IV pilus assembly protein PilM